MAAKNSDFSTSSHCFRFPFFTPPESIAKSLGLILSASWSLLENTNNLFCRFPESTQLFTFCGPCRSPGPCARITAPSGHSSSPRVGAFHCQFTFHAEPVQTEGAFERCLWRPALLNLPSKSHLPPPPLHNLNWDFMAHWFCHLPKPAGLPPWDS